jgi:hypothetical protein
MVALGPDLRRVAEDLDDAIAVARAAMRRARANVERLVAELPAIGYEFEAEPLVSPPPDAARLLDELEAEIGRLPLALRIWFEEVGQVNLDGRHPDWELDYPDPLVVEAPIDYIREEYRDWRESGPAEFELALAPDALHKADVSGGPPYSMTVPDDGADGLLLGEPHETTFVNYLRIAFRAGGMPGFADPPDALTAIAGRLVPL